MGQKRDFASLCINIKLLHYKYKPCIENPLKVYVYKYNYLLILQKNVSYNQDVISHIT